MAVITAPSTDGRATIREAARLKTPGGIAPWWYNWVDRHRVGGIVLVGVIATQLGTYFGYVFPAIGLPTLPWPLYNGILGTTFADGLNGATATGAFDPVFATSAASFFTGQALHFVNGIVFSILYAVLFLPLMPFRNTRGGNLTSGLLYSVIMSIISVGLLVPYAYVPEAGLRVLQLLRSRRLEAAGFGARVAPDLRVLPRHALHGEEPRGLRGG